MPKTVNSLEKNLQTNRVWKVLLALEKPTHKRLVKFLESPYFNQSNILLRLYGLYFNLIDQGKAGFEKEKIWKTLFPKVPYDDVNFRKFSSDLLKLVESFISIEYFESSPLQKESCCVSYIVQNKIDILYGSAYKEATQNLERKGSKSSDYYLAKFSLEKLYYEMNDFEEKVEIRHNVEEISSNLDYFYWIEKLRIYCAAISHGKTANFEYKVDFIESVIQHIEQHGLQNVPELGIYYYTFMTIKDETNIDNFYILKNLLHEFAANMPKRESLWLYSSALNYCIGRTNKGDKRFDQEYLEMFEEALNNNLFYINEELATWRFNNVVAAALRSGKVDWAEQFIYKYKNRLPSESRENTFSFNMARVFRYQNKFDKVLTLLQNIEYEDVGYNRIAKAMLIITYYELDEYDALSSFVESFRVYLNRHKNIPQQTRKGYLNLIKYVKRLTGIIPGDKKAIEKLKQDILAEKPSTVNAEWLLEKVEELL